MKPYNKERVNRAEKLLMLGQKMSRIKTEIKWKKDLTLVGFLKMDLSVIQQQIKGGDYPLTQPLEKFIEGDFFTTADFEAENFEWFAIFKNRIFRNFNCCTKNGYRAIKNKQGQNLVYAPTEEIKLVQFPKFKNYDKGM